MFQLPNVAVSCSFNIQLILMPTRESSIGRRIITRNLFPYMILTLKSHFRKMFIILMEKKKSLFLVWNSSKNVFACKISVDYYGKNSRRSKSP